MRGHVTAGAPGNGPGTLKDRLAVYRRYAAVVRAQHAALREEDVARFSELAEDRQKIQDELGQDAPGIPGPAEGEEEGKVMVDGIRTELEEVLALDRDIQARLIRMRGGVAAQLKEISSRRGGARKYLTRDSMSATERETRLNVRL